MSSQQLLNTYEVELERIVSEYKRMWLDSFKYTSTPRKAIDMFTQLMSKRYVDGYKFKQKYRILDLGEWLTGIVIPKKSINTMMIILARLKDYNHHYPSSSSGNTPDITFIANYYYTVSESHVKAMAKENDIELDKISYEL